jgi:TctA family transporter
MVSPSDDPAWRVRGAWAYWRAVIIMRLFLLAFLAVFVVILALLLGGPVEVLRPIVVVLILTGGVGIFLGLFSVRPVHRRIEETPYFADMDVFERGPKLFGMVVGDLFALKRWRPGP